MATVPTIRLNLIVEVTGEKDKEKEAKVSTAKTLWVPAVNNAAPGAAGDLSKSAIRGTRKTEIRCALDKPSKLGYNTHDSASRSMLFSAPIRVPCVSADTALLASTFSITHWK